MTYEEYLEKINVTFYGYEISDTIEGPDCESLEELLGYTEEIDEARENYEEYEFDVYTYKYAPCKILDMEYIDKYFSEGFDNCETYKFLEYRDKKAFIDKLNKNFIEACLEQKHFPSTFVLGNFVGYVSWNQENQLWEFTTK